MHIKMQRGGCFISDRTDLAPYEGRLQAVYVTLPWSQYTELCLTKHWHIFIVPMAGPRGPYTKVDTKENFYAGPFKSARIAHKIVQSIMDVETHSDIKWITDVEINGKLNLNQYVIRDIGIRSPDTFLVHMGNNIDHALYILKQHNEKYHSYIMHPVTYLEEMARKKVSTKMDMLIQQLQKSTVEIDKKDCTIATLRELLSGNKSPRRQIKKRSNR